MRHGRRPAPEASPAPQRISKSAGPPRAEASPSDKSRAPDAAQLRGDSRREVRGMPLSRKALRQAMLLNEILGVPKALQPPPGSAIS